MAAKPTTTEKILAEALELHEKGVSLHSIVRTYPEYKTEIEELFGAMATLSLKKETIRVPKEGLERLLAKLPEIAPAQKSAPIKSPFVNVFAFLGAASLRFVLPALALMLVAGSLIIHQSKKPGSVALAPDVSMPMVDTQTSSKTLAKGKSANTTAPAETAPMATMALMSAPQNDTDRLIAAFSQEAATEQAIAQKNDSENPAVTSEGQAMSDPTASYEN